MSWLALALAVALLLVCSLIRAAGAAVTRVPRADALRDQSEEIQGAATVAEILDERDGVSSAVGVVASGLLVVSSVLAMAVLGTGDLGQGLLAAAGVGMVALLVGDLAPRAIGRKFPHRLAYRLAPLLSGAVALGGWASDLISEPEPVEEPVDQEVEEDDQERDEQERELIDSVLEFGDTVVREVMTPRPDMVTVPVTASIEEVIDLSTEEGFSRLPVTSNGDIVGQVIVKDLLPLLSSGDHPQSVAEVMRPVVFVPETKQIAALLGEMKETHHHQVIAVDEYGDVTGLVTIEDLLEELVGEIADETDAEEALVFAGVDGWEVDARLPVDELEDITGVDLPDEEWDTVGGLVLGLAERVPEEGEVFEFDSLRLEVVRMQGRRVAEIKVRRANAEEVG